MSRKKIILFGSAGMLGHVLLKMLEEQATYEVIDVNRNIKMTDRTVHLDITNQQAVEQFILRENPDYIINCIGVLIRGSNSNPTDSIYVNAYFPHQLEKIGARINARLIHISTDCVFSGDKGRYKEDDYTDGKDTYAKTKALGEVINDKDLTIRTSIIGPEIKEKKNNEGLFNWFMQQSGDINGYSSAIWSGITTIELAKGIIHFLETDVTGLIHLTNGTGISKHDLIRLFQQSFQRPVKIHAVDHKVVKKDLVNTRTDFTYPVPSYEDMITAMASWIKRHKSLYNYN
jgi:dTDP-4-dehydrorhamnose reductase